MALRGDRRVVQDDISFFMNETGNRGALVSYNFAASGLGAALDDANATVSISSSGTRVAGVLMNDVVNKDLTQTHLNAHKDEAQIGGKVTILKRGWIVTDQIEPTASPSPGELAYLGNGGAGKFSDVASGTTVGRFGSSKDSDGYAKVFIDVA